MPTAAGPFASLLTKPPRPLVVGDGTAVFLAGRYHHPIRRTKRLEVGIGDAYTPAIVFTTGGPLAQRGRDLWLALVPIEPVEQPGTKALTLRATLAEGGEAHAELGSIELLPHLPYSATTSGPAPSGGEPPIAICMATWNPPLELFRRQIDSIRAQDHANWICVLSDDRSSPEAIAGIERVLGDDARFVLHRGGERLGFYRNFERALALVPASADFVALCDQDDEWHPDKLTTLRDAFAPATLLAYSDMRLVTPNGEVFSDTYWTDRETNYTDLRKLLLGNTITGAASMIRRELLDSALPFPPRFGELFHDHWLGCAALATGEIAYVDRPLFDYVQHRGSTQGHSEANLGATRPRRAWARWLRSVPSVAAGRRVPAFYTRVYVPAALIATTIELRARPRLGAERRQILREQVKASPGAMRHLLRAAVRPGLRRTATLGRERSFLAAVAWERVSAIRGRLRIGTHARTKDL